MKMLMLAAIMITTALAPSAQAQGAPEEPKEARSSGHAAQQPEFNLEGRWRLTLPAGFVQTVTVTRAAASLYVMNTPGCMTGTYQLSTNELTGLLSPDPRFTNFTWKVVDSQRLLLINSPPIQTIGSDYRGAVLSRLEP